YLESHSDVYAVESIFFPAVSNYLNPANVLFELQKRRIKYEFSSYLPTVTGQRAALANADRVILFDEDDPEIIQFLPGANLYSQVRPLVVGDPAFQKDLELLNADGIHKISIYARKHALHASPFAKMHPIAGFMPIEGPYPQWNLPLVRWAQGNAARALFSTETSGAGRLTMRARSAIAGQSIEVKSGGEPAGTCDLPVPNVFVVCSLPVIITH